MNSNPENINLKVSFSKIHELQNLIKLQRTQAHSLQELKNFLTDTIYKNHNSLLIKTIKLHQFCNNISLSKPFHYIIDSSFTYKEHIEPILKILISSQHSLYSLLTLVDKGYSHASSELSTLTTNLLTNNIFSIEAVSDDYLIIITRLIQDNISQLKSKHDIDGFLIKGKVLNALLSSLYIRQDIIQYFTEILHFPLTYIDYIEKDELFVFDVKKLGKVFQMQKGEENSRDSWRPTFFKRAANNADKHSNKNNEGNNNKHELDILKRKINLDEDAQEKIFLHIGLKFKNIDHSQVSILTETTFMDNYVPELRSNTIEQLIQNERDENMKQYLLNIKSKYETDYKEYSNNTMLNQMFTFASSKEIFELYRRFFCIVIQLIEEIFLHLELNFGKLPDILRYICKVIELSLKNKFPDICDYEIIPFLGVFIFDKVMKPLFMNPHLFGITDSMSLSSQTSRNIETLYKIITKFYRGELFTSKNESNFTLFNLFFITKMHIILHFFKKISTTTKLPSIIDKFLYPEKFNFDPSTFRYDFFEMHPHSHLKEICCMYTLTQVKELYNVINGNMKIIFGKDITNEEKEKILQCCDNIKKHYNDINNIEEQLTNRQIISLKTFSIITKSKLFEQMERFLKGDVHICQLDSTNKELILSYKKCFCSCLNNIAPLSGYQTELILNSNDYKNINLAEALQTLASNIICQYNIFKWDLEQLSPSHYKLPIYYTENNYELFMKEITNEINESLVDVDKYISIIGSYNDDITYLKNELLRINEIFTYIKKEMILKTVKRFVEQARIKITFGFLTSIIKNTKSFVLKRKRDNLKSRTQICETIQQFIINFPNLNEMTNKENIFEFMKETNVLEGLNTYFKIIKEEINNQYTSLNLNECEKYFSNDPFSPYNDSNTLPSEVIIDSNINDYRLPQLNDSFDLENSNYFALQATPTPLKLQANQIDIKEYTINQLHEQIMDYILGKIYDNIFPLEGTNDDKSFEMECKAISKKTIIEFEPFANLDLQDCIVESVECMHRFEKASSPLEKAFQFNKMLTLIKRKLVRIKGGEIAPDDYLPYIWYSIIKAKPKQFKTNMLFLELFGVGNYNYAFTTIKTIENRINMNKEESRDTADTTIVSEGSTK